MKNLIVASVLAISSLTTMYSQTGMADYPTIKYKPVSQEYREVKISEVPQAVQDAVAAKFADVTISKAYVNDDGIYKLEILTPQQDDSLEEEEAQTVYLNSEGKWMK